MSASAGVARGARACTRRRLQRFTQQRRLRAFQIADALVLVIAVGAAADGAAGRFAAIGLAWGLGYAALTLVILQIRGFYSFRLQASVVDIVARLFAASSVAAMSMAFARSLVSVGALVGRCSPTAAPAPPLPAKHAPVVHPLRHAITRRLRRLSWDIGRLKESDRRSLRAPDHGRLVTGFSGRRVTFTLTTGPTRAIGSRF